MNLFLVSPTQQIFWLLSVSRNQYKFSVLILLLGVIPLFSGCVAPAIQNTAVTTITTEPILGAESSISDDFSLQGRVSVKNSNQSVSSGVHWRHTGVGDEILLFSPLGQTMAQIQQDHTGARMSTSGQKNYSAADVESLTSKILGWRLPLSGLQYWVQGAHAPATSSVKDLDSENRAVAIRQDGWQVSYKAYFPAQQTQVSRPRILELSYRDLKIRLVVDNWEAK